MGDACTRCTLLTKPLRKNMFFARYRTLILATSAAAAIGFGTDAAAFSIAGFYKTAEKPAPVFVPLDPFTVNLRPENGEHFLQASFTLQLASPDQVPLIQLHMPQIRSRLLSILSQKRAMDVLTREGKEQLSREIAAGLNRPFHAIDKRVDKRALVAGVVVGVFITAFIVQT